MSNPNIQMLAMASHWLGKLSPTLFVILTFIYWKATSSSDGKVGQSTEAIAAATGFARRTVQPALHELAVLGAIQILSTGKERMLIEIPQRYWCPPVAVVGPDEGPVSTPELIYRLCGERPSPETLAFLTAAAGNDDQRVQHCLDSFFRKGEQWTTLELLTVAVQHDLKSRGYFSDYWIRP